MGFGERGRCPGCCFFAHPHLPLTARGPLRPEALVSAGAPAAILYTYEPVVKQSPEVERR